MRKNKKYKKNSSTYVFEAIAIIAFVVAILLIPDMIHYFMDVQKSTKRLDSNDVSRINEDYYCNLYIPDSDITFPVVRGTDNLKYLHTAVTGEESELGAIFMDYRCDAATSPHTIIYGHDARDLDGSLLMFGQLRYFLEEDFIQNHSEICLDKDGKVKHYNIFAVKVTDISDEAYYLDFSDELEFHEFANRMGAPENTEEILTLSTCLGGENNARLLVQGALVN
ncbi:MAG: class B sortase [Acetatifactor sp.]|nr:class B sortase [Acetatifactor sp.]